MAANNLAANVPSSFWGYRRDNGRVGIRNHVLILPLDDISNAACEAVANNIKGTCDPARLRAPAVRGDLELRIGTGCNPKARGIGIEPGWTALVDGMRPASRSGFSIEEHGDLATIAAASAPPRSTWCGHRSGAARSAASTISTCR